MQLTKRIFKKFKMIFCKFLMQEVLHKGGLFFDRDSEYATHPKFEAVRAVVPSNHCCHEAQCYLLACNVNYSVL